jgi:hypothetical protein
MGHTTIFHWLARRSGGRITITGKDGSGAPLKAAAIDTIQPENGQLIATDKDGRRFILAI